MYDKDSDFMFRCVVKNSGATPALGMQYFVGRRFGSASELPVIDLRGRHFPKGVLALAAGADAHTGWIKLTRPEYREMVRIKQSLFIYCINCYRDIYNTSGRVTPHIEKNCFRIDFSVPSEALLDESVIIPDGSDIFAAIPVEARFIGMPTFEN